MTLINAVTAKSHTAVKPIKQYCNMKILCQEHYDKVVKYAKEIGCYNLTLNVWSCNESAQKFYERQGLKPQKTTMETIL